MHQLRFFISFESGQLFIFPRLSTTIFNLVGQISDSSRNPWRKGRRDIRPTIQKRNFENCWSRNRTLDVRIVELQSPDTPPLPWGFSSAIAAMESTVPLEPILLVLSVWAWITGAPTTFNGCNPLETLLLLLFGKRTCQMGTSYPLQRLRILWWKSGSETNMKESFFVLWTLLQTNNNFQGLWALAILPRKEIIKLMTGVHLSVLIQQGVGLPRILLVAWVFGILLAAMQLNQIGKVQNQRHRVCMPNQKGRVCMPSYT